MINAGRKWQRQEEAIGWTEQAVSRSRRRAALARYQILDSASEIDFDNIAMLAARICGTKFAAISFVDDHRQWFKAEYGLGICEAPIEQSFCAFAIRSNQLFLVNDASCDLRFAANPLVVDAPHIRFYAGMRILANDGTPIASLCVIDPTARPEGITEDQRMTLQVLAGQVQSLLELRLRVAAGSALSERLRYVAEHDETTGLPHRSVFNNELAAALREAEFDGNRVAIMLVDLYRFQKMSDPLDHQIGNALLCSFAKRLRTRMPSNNVVARLGRGKLGIILRGFERTKQISTIVDSLNKCLHEPIKHDGRLVECRVSIGVAIYPDHGSSAEELSKCGELALAAAKANLGRTSKFRPTMADQLVVSQQMHRLIRRLQ